MTIEQLQHSMMSAMKNGDRVRKDVLSSAVAAIKKAAIDKGCRDNITEELVMEVLRKEEKTLQEQVDTCPAEREELKQEYTTKLTILKEYLPELLNDPVKIKSIIDALVAAADIVPTKANKGAVMKVVMPNLKGKTDMKIVNQVVAEMLM